MLSLIRVKNYAVVDEIELELTPGFIVMTGETGAGKSILVDALGLALGDRADASIVRPGAERAEISVQFDCPAEHESLAWLRERGLDDGDVCMLRRIVGAEGRSRAFVNGQPVALQDLRALGALLVDIHGQHAHQSLLESASQRAFLDAFGGLEPLAAQVDTGFAEWQRLVEELEGRRGSSADRAAQLELLRFQAADLEALALTPGEVEALRAERDRLANTDRLIGGVSAALDLLYENETASAYSAVVQARQELERSAEHDETLAEPGARLSSVEIELREIASSLSHYRDRLEADPARLEKVEARLAKVRALARRHGVADEALHEVASELQRRIADLDGGGESLAALEARVAHADNAYFAAAQRLSAGRGKAAKALSKKATAQLRELGMPHGELRVELEPKPRERADGTGLERVDIQVRLNPGQAFGPLARVASGGELSRISLALEVVRSGATPVPSLVFDEVDAGIGGGVAEIVGRRLAGLAVSRQVLCVTHLPQVASQGRHHYRVAKLTDGKTSRTSVELLSSPERVDELSRMLGGVEITATTRAHAAEMMERAAR
jgi:DNA repair protein RecN (Recombination protein N)